MTPPRVAVIGAGVAGLVAAVELAARGLEVVLLERGAQPGGKMRRVRAGPAELDAGPTVFTMRPIFEAVFNAAGTSLEEQVTLHPADTLARHAWSARERLDLFADRDRSAEAIAEFAGPAEGRRYQAFCAEAARIYHTLETPFLHAPAPSLPRLIRHAGLSGLGDLLAIKPFTSMWRALGRHFHDPRLRQLFGRYATYCGGSPFQTPATLMLVAHVEQDGVWLVEGGLHRLAQALAQVAQRQGADIRYGVAAQAIVTDGGRVTGLALDDGTRLPVDAVVSTADVGALAAGRLGQDVRRAVPPVPRRARSLSAVTFMLHAEAGGFPLLHHNVFFSRDYRAEFDAIFRHGRLPDEPTVYICAQDRGDRDGPAAAEAERLFALVNAPPCGDSHPFDPAEIESCAERTFAVLARCGLTVQRRPETTAVTTPAGFEALFPGTGGALYGRAPHGWTASFRRPGVRSRVPGLYLAGGSTHPGPGIPMAALSGRLAAASLLQDLGSSGTSRPAATSGGTSTRSARTAAMG